MPERGFGFIRAIGGNHAGVDFFFHMSALQGCRMHDLAPGALVRFTPQEAAKGWRAETIELVQK